MIRDFDFC
ncbi:hypothetical protein Ccrd_020907 [Cynara cardunculus var. scolymus]|uniref:Uncharacterized protein n=1 Tax=Cynara cardunculus var. scolymus TaxID=59895 RepID=A0A103Y1K0_CYNCS|nr:hypothetical protein Ccrd_020907 [Cynara cardunculus var. scolymus]